MAHENPSPAWRIARPGWIQRPCDRHVLNAGIIGIDLPQVVRANRAALHKRHTERMRPGFYLYLQIERRRGVHQLETLAIQRDFQLIALEADGAQTNRAAPRADLDCILG